MIHKAMEVYSEVFLQEGNKKVTRFFIVAISGQEQQAIKKLNFAVMKYVFDTGVSYSHFKEVDNPYVQIIVEGIND